MKRPDKWDYLDGFERGVRVVLYHSQREYLWKRCMKSFYGITGVIREISADEESAHIDRFPCQMGMSMLLTLKPRYAVVCVEN